MLGLIIAAVGLTGCGTACGPIRTVPPQRLALGRASPDTYVIRVQPKTGACLETPVPATGRVIFAVPVTSRASTVFCFWIPVYSYPPPEKLRVIRLMRGGKTLRKLSAQDIGKLPTDADGYHLLRLDR